jgi:hypothetical protein
MPRGYVSDSSSPTGWRRPSVDPRIFSAAQDFYSNQPYATDDDVWELAAKIQNVIDNSCRKLAEKLRSNKMIATDSKFPQESSPSP